MYKIENIKNMILSGNVYEQLKLIPDESINMVITSPPYYGLRSYGTVPVIWGGDENCEHRWSFSTKKGISGGTKSEKVQIKNEENFQIVPDTQYGFCSKCDAWLGELGQEPNFKLFINHLVLIFDEVKRVLTKDGTCWVNLGDSYAGSGQGEGWKNPTGKQATSRGTIREEGFKSVTKNQTIRNKSLMGIPDRFKIAMIDNGWICRNEIVWYKRNAIPDSTRDRFTVDFEKFYFFTKEGKYFFNQQKEPCVNGDPNPPRGSKGTKTSNGGRRKQDELGKNNCTGFNDRYIPKTERNVRCVWDIPVQPFRGSHFATFPPKLIETPILAGCPENGIVLDIFFGSGTSGLVAKSLNRNWLGIEINPDYIEIAKKRLSE